MKLAIFVHDFFTEVGHSRAMIELVRNLPERKLEQIDEIKVISFNAGDLKAYFPFPNIKLTLVSVPFPWLYPFISKAIFFQIYTFFYSLFFLGKDYLRIGIGTASMNVDIVNIQFIQGQYENLALNSSRHSLFKWCYKFILFKYFRCCEKVLYQKNNLKFLVPANFLAEHLMTEFGVPKSNIELTYSSVNTTEFNFKYKSKVELLADLTKNYSVLNDINPERPIFLFVGAFERKGLNLALKYLASLPSSQFIIIGKSETKNRPLEIPGNVNSYSISHTTEIPLFYELADAFIFPTQYEPFGLVIHEAFAMGLDVFVTEKEVGATELIKNQDAVYMIENLNPELLKIKVLSYQDKTKRREERLKLLQHYSWKNSSLKFEKFLN